MESLLSGAAGVLLGTVVTLWYSRRESRREAAFALLLTIQRYTSNGRGTPFGVLQEEILRFYSVKVPAPLSEAAKAYMDYLEALDLYLFAASRRLIDGQIGLEWIRDALSYDRDVEDFVRNLRTKTGNGAALEYLMRHYGELRRDRRISGQDRGIP